MHELIKHKFVITAVVLSLVGVSGAAYTMAHSGPTTANAQTAVTTSNTQTGQDKEVKDDNVSPQPSGSVQQKADTHEVDETGAKGATKEVEDGN
ncbi:MAG: hypothetical protein ACREHC_08590 [Candidatus Levyibacteriota bacterium]